MAMSGSGRGPIKVGSGYIDVFPKLNTSKLRETRAQIEKQMGATGKKAGKLFSAGLTEEIAKVPQKAKQAASKAQKEIQKSAMDSKKVLKRIESEITKEYGKEAGKRFKAAAQLEKDKKKLLESTSAETRKAIRATVQEEENANKTKAKSWAAAEKERLRLLRQREKTEAQASRDEARRWETAQRSYMKFMAERTKAAEKAARDEAAAQRRSQIQQREELRRTLMQARAERLADLRSQMDTHRTQLASLRGQLQTYRRQIQDHTQSVGRSLTGLQTGWRKQGEAIERLGTNITETGRIISTNLLLPLGAVASLITSIGVNSADMKILGQMGLTAAGVDKKKSASEMSKIQNYAIDTPFSIDTMHEYQMKLIRSIAGNDDTWYEPKTRTKAANRAANKTSDIIMSIGDTMSRAGNLDPSMFQRAMYAVDRIMDMDKAPTRNINQLVQATGIPAGELAKMFGFNTAGDFWKKVGTPVAKGGGISGTDMIDNLLQQWDPGYFKLDKNGKRIKDKASGQSIVNSDAHSTAGGSKGYGERMTSATISGRIQQMKERGQFELGKLFAEEDPKTGQYRYTKLGESIMGKATGKDKNGNTQYEGGLIQKVQQLAGDQKGNAIALTQTALSALGTFVDQIQWFSDWLESHPEVKKVFTELLKVGAAVLPFVIAIGLATKVFGKMAKIFSSALTPVKGLFKGIRGGVRTARQAGSAVRAGLSGDGDPGSIRDRMTSRYQERRTQLRGGDARGPIARTRDRVTGRDSGANQLRQGIRDTEDAVSDTEDAIRRLQREIRDVNSQSIRQLIDQFEGNSPSGNSLTAANRTAQTQINNTTTQVTQLNRGELSSVVRQFENLKDKADLAEKAIKDVTKAVQDLNSKNLNGLKLTVESAIGTVGDLQDKVKNTTLDVSDLNKKELGKLSGQFHSARDACETLREKIRDTIREIGNLNRAKIDTIRGAFRGAKASLYNAVNDVYKLVGTSKSGLNGRLTNLNSKSLAKIIKSVKDLKEALDDSGDKAKTLNDRLNDISNHAPGKSGSNPGSKGGSKKGKKTKSATGGVLPGYTPGRDVHVFSSPTAGELHLSGGESVMRPEFTAALGEATVNKLNLAARTKGIPGVRNAMQFARGGVLGRLGLNDLVEASRNFNVANDARGALATMTMDSSSRALGGDVQSGVVGAGTDGSHYVGKDFSKKFKGMFDFMTEDSWDILKKAPIPDGYTQVIGAIGGTLAPIQGEYFWNDVWKGKGNILERGEDYLGDIFSTKTLSSIVSNLFGGIWDSAKSLWAGAKGFASDPAGFISDGIEGVWELTKSQYTSVVDMVKSLREVWQSPMDYASQVISDTYSTAKENLPSLDGLFDFSGDGLSSKKPDVSKILESGGPGSGRALSWARTQNGKPYQWGGNGNPSWDCSGFMSAIESVLRGQKPHRRWATGAFRGSSAPDGWVRGLNSPFMIGVTNAGVGHTAGTINGTNVESRGGDGVVVGPRARGWSSALFTDVYGFRPAITQGYWTGTLSASPGLAMVGEKGPELVDFKGGERVYDHGDTASMLTGGRPVSITVNEARHEVTPQAVLRGLQWYDTMYGSRI